MILPFVTFLEVITLSKELVTKSVEELAPLLREREISPVELTQEILEHAESHNERINAYITITRKQAEEAALQAEKEIADGNYRGMYHGIPMGIKDNLYFKNEVTTMASKIHGDFVSDFDATVVSKLREAGVIFTGKLNMHEYAWGITNNNPHFGACRNPWDTEKIPGGSSGGSGAAVAADMSVASLGTDTAGSIRIPSSACGIVGLKPTHGRVSKYGCFPLAWSLDHIGPMTKTVKDAAGLLEVIAGYDKNDPTSVNVPIGSYTEQLTGNVKDLVIGINEEYFFNHVDADIEKLVRQGIQRLVDQGAKVEEVSIPSLRYAEYAEMITILAEAAAIHHRNLLARPEDFGKDIRLLFELGEIPSAVDYLQSQQIRRQLKQDFQKAFEKVNVLITPTLPILPPKIGEEYADLNGEKVDLIDHIIRFTGPGNLTGLPALTVPCGFKEGMPVGLQIIGPAFKEGTILNVGYAVEKTNPLKGKKPDLVIS
ncbi:aspartyl-tRNA(Asn)/glutamyl-tRNA(Gln) amidotransferase subunit A [Aneurinibacillus migulanus]|uniref:Aspartyl-tRNA(Asn)/glutamyl-tRNA(Gln) amidotransferase subunit A n=1 Tax=Aneurinibacillus migulanus TaxID=47500 RepID=A0A1G8LQS6_ANEMI|nr:aspartyl-tRNA(Asn)/glutamyl-tRNA(Gln) amidotransferase subunit A [Aneurinibacillus migulanus]